MMIVVKNIAICRLKWTTYRLGLWFNDFPQEDFLLEKALLEHIPKFVAYFACFFVISAYWGCHVRLYNLVVNSNDVLTWINLVSCTLERVFFIH